MKIPFFTTICQQDTLQFHSVSAAVAIKISSMAEGIVCVKFGSLKSPLRSKLVTLPAAGAVGNRCDLLVYTGKSYTDKCLLTCQSFVWGGGVLLLGGSVNTPFEDVILSQYDDRFGQALDITSTTVLLDRASDIQL